MSSDARSERLAADYRILQALRDESTIFDFNAGPGDPPKKFVLIFKGKGVRRDRNASGGYAIVDEHRCELTLGYGYPDRPPELRWMTPIYHPNVTFSGFISLKDLGVPWDKAVGVDVVCERLWDTARMAYYDLQHASNYNAKNWLETEVELKLPVDPRPLRDGPSEEIGAGSNVVQYRKRQDGGMDQNARRIPPANLSEPADVFFIEDEKKPDAPIVFDSPVRNRRKESRDDDILFID